MTSKLITLIKKIKINLKRWWENHIVKEIPNDWDI